MAFASDGKTLVSGGAHDGEVRLWDVATGKEIHTSFPGHQAPDWCVAFSPDGKTVTSGGLLWEAATGKKIRILQNYDGTVRDGTVRSVAFSPDGKIMAAVSLQTAHLWEVSSGREIKKIRIVKDHKERAVSVTFTLDGKAVALVVSDVNSSEQVRLWEIATDKEICTLQGARWPVTNMAFSSDSKTVAAGGGDTVCLWEAASDRKLRTLKCGFQGVIRSMAFSPNGKIVAAGGDDGACLWEVSTGKEIRTLQQKGRICWGVAFAPNGRMLAAASGSQVRLWDLLSGKELPPLVGHRDVVRGIAFSPDGRTLVSVSNDATGLVWDLTHGTTCSTTKRDPVAQLALWADLSSQDAARAWRAMWTLAATPAQSIPLLRDRLRPVPADTGKRMARLIADLDADEFPVRQKAYRALEELGLDVEPALRKGLESSSSAEVRRSLGQLLESLEKPNQRGFSGEMLRGLRAVMVLELVGTPEAWQVLKVLAAGAPGFCLTREAQAALNRLNRARAARRSGPGA